MAQKEEQLGKNPSQNILYMIVEICQSKRGFIMKKKVIILAMVTAMCSAALLAGCGEEPTQQASAVEIPSSSQSFDDNTNEVDSMASSPIFNVDWDRCTTKQKNILLWLLPIIHM